MQEIKKTLHRREYNQMAAQRGILNASFLIRKNIKTGGEPVFVQLRTFTEFAAQLGPGASLFADAEAQTVAIGNVHTTITQLQLFVE